MFDPDGPVANVVLEHSATASVLDRLHIDYCCRGHEPLSRVCRERGLDVAAVIVDLEKVSTGPDENADPRTAPTSALISRVLAQQHRNLRATLTLLQHQARDLAVDLGGRHPVLRVIASNVDQLAVHMLAHLDHEEEVLFPALLTADEGTLRAELGHMFDEHREFGDHFRRLRETADDYRPPAGADPDVADLYDALIELEHMVSRHHHVENHVLLPRFL